MRRLRGARPAFHVGSGKVEYFPHASFFFEDNLGLRIDLDPVRH